MELYQLEDKLFEIDRQIHEINYCEKEIESIAFCLDECSLMGEIDLKISRLFRIGVIKNNYFKSNLVDLPFLFLY